MTRRDKNKPPRPDMKWSLKHRMWVDADNRSEEQCAKDEAILREAENDRERIEAAAPKARESYKSYLIDDARVRLRNEWRGGDKTARTWNPKSAAFDEIGYASVGLHNVFQSCLPRPIRIKAMPTDQIDSYVSANEDMLEKVRLWDWEAAFAKLKPEIGLIPYLDFQDSDIVRFNDTLYWSASMKPILPPTVRAEDEWFAQHLVYTHVPVGFLMLNGHGGEVEDPAQFFSQRRAAMLAILMACRAILFTFRASDLIHILVNGL